MPGFQSFFRSLNHFVYAILIRVKGRSILLQSHLVFFLKHVVELFENNLGIRPCEIEKSCSFCSD